MLWQQRFSVFVRAMFLISLLLFSDAIPVAVRGQEPGRNRSSWRATVACDLLLVYSQMSLQSRLVGQLKKGNIVTIHLEFISADGAWCSISEPGSRMRWGYVPSACLEREETDPVTKWEAKSLPPSETRPNSEPAQHTNITTQQRPTREEIEREVDRVLAARLNALLPANDFGQTTLREPFGFNEQSSFLFLPRFGMPFNFFQHRIAPRITSSVQIRPSHIFRRR